MRGGQLARALLMNPYRGATAASVRRQASMLYYAAMYLVIAVVAAIFGFSGVVAGAAGIAKFLFFIFLMLFACSLVWGLVSRNL